MSYNGSGTFQINTSGQPVVAGTVISSTAFNALTADLATGLSTAITKDGQTTATARIPFAQGINSTLTTDSSSVSTGSILTAGGVGIAKAAYVGTTLNVGGASTFTGAIAVDSITDSTSTTTGSIQTDGGVGIAKALYVGTNANVAGTLAVTGVATFSAAPIYSSLTASSAVATDASKGLVSVTNTGTGNNVLATAPTIASANLTTALTLTGAAGTTGQALTSQGTGVAPIWTTVSSDTVGFKNRIINGAMVIDQRNAGASVTPTSGAFTVDRWQFSLSQASKLTAQQSSTAPAGFTKSLLVTSSSAYTVGSTEVFGLLQPIEGLNMTDVGFGAAGASTLTLSFWVRSSLTGTFGGVLTNYANDRSYPFSYTISTANTFEQKTITIAGDTTGTWATTNTGWGQVWFGLGVGSTKSTTANAWAAGAYYAPTGATSVVGTNGATWYVTGVQLEKGSTATSFDYRPIGTELALCQRYFEKSDNQATAILTNSRQTVSVREATNIPDQVPIGQQIFYAVTKRTSGTVTTYPFTTASNINRVSNGSGTDYGASSGLAGGLTDAGFYVYNGSGGTLTVSANQTIIFNWYSSAEL